MEKGKSGLYPRKIETFSKVSACFVVVDFLFSLPIVSFWAREEVHVFFLNMCR